MKTWPALALCAVGAGVIATLVFAGERLAFEAQAVVLRPTIETGDAITEPPDVVVRCDKPDCIAGFVFYEVLVDATGRPRAVRFEWESRLPERSARNKGAKAVLAARWPAPVSGRPIRAFQGVSVLPHERLPTGQAPFPETDGHAVSITLERGGIYNPGGIYSVTLNSDGDVDFCGLGVLKAPGPHQARISPAAFEALVQKFRDADFFSLDDHYVSNNAEGVDDYLRVRIGDQEKTVMDASGREVGMPTVIRNLQKAVDDAAETSQWVGSREERVTYPEAGSCPTGLREEALQAFRARRMATGL